MFQSGSMSRLALFFLNAAFGAVAIEAALSAGVAAEGVACAARVRYREMGLSAAEDDRSEVGWRDRRLRSDLRRERRRLGDGLRRRTRTAPRFQASRADLRPAKAPVGAIFDTTGSNFLVRLSGGCHPSR